MLWNLFHSTFGRLAGRLEGRPKSGSVVLWLLRGIFGAIVIGLSMVAFRHYMGPNDPATPWVAFLAILGVGLLVVLTDVLVRNKQITTVSAVYFGLLLGLLLGNILSTALDPFVFPLTGQNDRYMVFCMRDQHFNAVPRCRGTTRDERCYTRQAHFWDRF